jgi:nicotinamidase-related amidase
MCRPQRYFDNMSAYVTKKMLASKTRKWLEQVAPYNRDHLRLASDHAALLVVDMQNYFLAESAPAYLPAGAVVMPNVSKIIKVFRKAKRPVVFTRHVHHPDGLDAGIMGWWWNDMIIEGSPESEIHRDLAPLPNEKVILKHRYSAFYHTDLETVLRALKIDDLVICGVMTNLCCESTARDAFYRDFRVFFPADGTASVSEEMHVASLMNLAYGFAVISSVGDIIKQV